MFSIEKLIAILLVFSPIYISAKSFTIGAVPQQSIEKTKKIWQPIVDELKRSGITLTVDSEETMRGFLNSLDAAKWDFVYINPLQYVSSNKSVGYLAFAKQQGKKLKGILVAKKSSQFKEGDLTQFRGKTICFPAPGAFAASIILQNALIKAEVSFTPSFEGNHDKSYASVLSGICELSGGVRRSLNANPNASENLKIVFESEGYPPHAFAYNPKLNEADRNTFIEAFLQLKPEAFKAMKFKAGIERATDKDWESVRSIKL